MDNIFSEKIDLDELYDRKQQINEHRISIYQKILNKVHKKIKFTARQKHDNQFCFFLIPEILLGVPKYNIQLCIEYIIEKLTDNGFIIKYTHPNLLFISWKHYIPAFQRSEIKKKTGCNIDGFGNMINNESSSSSSSNENDNPIKSLFKTLKTQDNKKIVDTKKDYKDISTYKPMGIYNMDYIKKINDKLD